MLGCLVTAIDNEPRWLFHSLRTRLAKFNAHSARGICIPTPAIRAIRVFAMLAKSHLHLDQMLLVLFSSTMKMTLRLLSLRDCVSYHSPFPLELRVE